MGAAVYLKFEKPVVGFDHIAAVDGKAVAKAWDSLNDFALSHGLTPLHDFLSMSAEDFSALIGDEAVAQSAAEIPAEKWFEATSARWRLNRFLRRFSQIPLKCRKPSREICFLTGTSLARPRNKTAGFISYLISNSHRHCAIPQFMVSDIKR